GAGLKAIARLAIRRPLPILIFWAGACVLSLFFISDARNGLHETNLQIPGTDADKAAQLTQKQFDGSISLAILLKAPTTTPKDLAALDDQGRALVDRLQKIEG